MKNYITHDDWMKIAKLLMEAKVGFTVSFDSHHLDKEILININTISIPVLHKEKEE